MNVVFLVTLYNVQPGNELDIFPQPWDLRGANSLLAEICSSERPLSQASRYYCQPADLFNHLHICTLCV